MKIAIIGAGFSGCLIYKKLIANSFDVTLFDKSRGTGGRLSTKYIGNYFIDHGTSIIKSSDDNFINFLDRKVREKVLIKKDNSFIPKNGINKLCSSMINKEDLIKNTRIIKADYLDNKWSLEDENGKVFNDFDALILTIPTPQILDMKISLDEKIKKSLEKINYDSIVSLICHRKNRLDKKIDQLMNNKDIKKVVNNSLKYNYNDFDSYVIHFNEEFSNRYSNLSKDEIFKEVYSVLNKELNFDIRDEFETIQHFWKYAFSKNSLDEEFLFDNESFLGICGDYFKCNNLKSSFHSAIKLSEKLITFKN